MEPIRYELDNGLKVILQSRPTAPVVACSVWVNVGSADETPKEAGLAHVHEHMLFKGTQRRGVGEVAKEVESSGGYINAFTSFDHTCYYIVMSSRQFETGVDILSDVIRNSSFEADELERELEVIQEEIKRGIDSPQRVASQMMFDTAYSTHPYRLPVIGSKESVASFKRENVVAFFNKHYRPANMTLVLVGDFTEEDARAMVDAKFGDWNGDGYTRPERPNEPPQKDFRGIVDSKEMIENHLRCAFHIPDIQHQDIPAIDILTVIMGYGEASHLHQTIQREKQMTSGVYAMAYTPRDAGVFMVGADYQITERAPDHATVLESVLQESFRFRHMKVTDADITRSRTLIESQEIYSQQSAEGLAMKMGRGQTVTGDPGFDARYYAALSRVTAADIKRVANLYLHPNKLTVALLRSDTSLDVSVDTLQEAAQRAFESIEAEAVDAGIQLDSRGLFRVQIPNGPVLIVQEDHTVETFALRTMTLGGLRYETSENNGVTPMMSEMITHGTSNRSAMDIARETDSMASGISGISGRNSFGVSMSGISRFFDGCFDIFADCTMNSTVPADEFEREQRLHLQAIVSQRDQLGYVNFRRFQEAFFGDYPYGMPGSGTEASIQALTPDAVRDFMTKLIRPSAMVLTAVGDVDAADVLERVERFFVRPEGAAPYRPKIPALTPRTEPKLVMGDLEKEQAFVTVGFNAPVMADDSRYALEVLYAILSGQGGRLFYELRDKQSLAYSVYASMLLGIDASAFTINIGTSPEKVEQAVGGIFVEVHKLLDAGVTDDEIERAKTYLSGNHDIGLQKNGSRAMSFALDELYGFPFDKTLDYSDRLAEVTRADVSKLIQDHLVPSQAVVSITKPEATKLDIDLAKYI